MPVTYVAQSSPMAVTTSVAVTFPEGIQAGDLLIILVATTSTSAAAPSGWVQMASSTGGGLTVAAHRKLATGPETGSVTVSTPGGTKGLATMVAYRPPAGFSVAVPWADPGIDQDGTSTTLEIQGSLSRSVSPDDLMVGFVMGVAPGSETFSGVLQGATTALTVPDATFASGVGRSGTRTGSNTLVYVLTDRLVTGAGSGFPKYTGTAQGANPTGAGILFLLRSGPVLLPPVSRANVPVSVLAGSEFTVTDTSTPPVGETISGRSWRIVSGGGSLSSSTASSVTVTAPEAPGTMAIGITATASNGVVGSEQTYSISALAGAVPKAGPDQEGIESLEQVHLDAAASTGSPTVYQWRQIEGPGVEMSNWAARNPSFKAPATVEGAVLVFGLKVGTSAGMTDLEDTVTIRVRPHIEWVTGRTIIPVHTLAV